MSTAAGGLRKAMKPLIVCAVDDPTVQVSLGYPWPQEANDIISVGQVSSQLSAATMGTARTRDEQLTLEVLISVFRPGGADQEQVVSDRAYELLDDIEHHLRMTDPTVGGRVLWCLLAGHEMDSNPFDDGTTQGRVVEILATFAAQARVRS